MHIGEELRAELVEAVYRQAGGARAKCVALARQLNSVYAAEKLLNEELSRQGHEDFQRLRELGGQALAAVLEGGGPALANPDAFFSAEEQRSADFARPPALPARHGWWARTLGAIPSIAALVEAEDAPALEFLAGVEVLTQPTRLDYTVEFRFEPNPFFSNDCLRVEALHGAAGLEEEITELRSTPIQWKEGRDLTSGTRTTKGRGKGRPRKTVAVKKRSLFLLFANLRQPDEEEDEAEEPAGDGPPTDAQIFYDACDVLETLRHDLFTCLVPLLLGAEVGFLGQAETPPAGKPDCKAQ